MRARVVGTAVALALALGPLAASAWAGAWGAPMDLGPVASSGTFGTEHTGAVAMDASGTAVVAWVMVSGKMVAAVRPPGGVFGALQDLGPDAGSNLRVALDGSGRALVVWNSGGSLQAAERAPGSTFTRLAPIASVAGFAPADVAFLADGTAIVGYRGGDRLPHVAVRAPGGTFVSSTLSTVAARPLGGGPVRVAAAGGYAIAAWRDEPTVGSTNRTTTKAMVSVLTPGGGFGTPVELMATTYDAFDPSARPQVVGIAPRIAPSGAADVAVSSIFDTWPALPRVMCSTDTLATRAPGPAGSWTMGAGDASATCTTGLPSAMELATGPPRTMDLATGPRGDGLLVLGRGLDEPRIAVTSKVRAVGAATYAPGPDVFVGPAGPRAHVPVRVAPLSDGRYVVLFLQDSDVRAVAGDPALAFEPSALVAAHPLLPALLGAASSGSEAVAAWTNGTAVGVALYDDRATPTVALSEVAMTRRSFLRSTTIRWRASVPATLTFRVVRLNGSHERSIGSFVRSVEADMGSLRFHGVVDGHRLRPGRYRLSVVASAPAMAASAPASVTFTVRRYVRPRRAG
jgi:hypothetical protein